MRSLSVVACLLVTLWRAAGQDVATPVSQGRALYHEARLPGDQPVAAVAGDGNVSLPAAFAACVRCHGEDARGRTESGVAASDIRWETLTKPYDVTLPGGRRREPYDEEKFLAAITRGIDSAGRPLNPAMPRYKLTQADAAALIAYLQQRGPGEDEGVTEEAVRIGLLTDSPASATALADRAMLAAFFAEANRNGGAFRRRLELIDIGQAESGKKTPQVLVIIAAQSERAAPCPVTSRVPTLHLVAARCSEGGRCFALYPGLVQRSVALARHAAALTPGTPPRIALLHTPEQTPRDLIDETIAAVRAFAAISPVLLATDDPDATARLLRETNATHVLPLGDGGVFPPVIAAANRAGWHPFWLRVDASAPATDGRSLAAEPVPPSDLTADALKNYRRWTQGASATTGDDTRRQALLAVAQLLLETLKRTGREVTRTKIVAQLEATRDFRGDYSPPLSFTPRRHAGVDHVRVTVPAASEAIPTPFHTSLD